MKKLLGVLFALALVVPAMAGNIFSNVETYGEIQTIGSLSENSLGPSVRDVSNRVMFGLGMDLVEDTRANVSFLNSGYWGRGNSYAGDNVDDTFLQDTYVVEANVAISNIFGVLDAKIGRQFYGDEDSSVVYFGPTHYRTNIMATSGDPSYAQVADSISIDAAVLSYTGENWAINAIYAKLDDAFAINDEDITFGGFDVKANVTNNLMLQAYMYDFRDGTDPSKEKHIGFWGVKPVYMDDIFTASAEFAKNYEDQVFGYNDRGWLLKADVKVNYALSSLDFAPRIGYTHTEKGFGSYGNYLPGLIFSNTVGQMYRGEDALRILNAGMDFKFAALDKFSFALDYFAMSYTQLSGRNSHAQWLGNEFDLMAKYALNEYVELHAGVGYMTNVGQGFAYQNDDPYTGQLGMIIKF